jgi:hypothetical protein
MTQVNPFLDILQRKPPQPDLRQPVLQVLKDFCEGISQYAPGDLTCRYVLGYPTNYGQEYRVVITSTRTKYEHTLLRVYIPATGTNLKADFYDYQLLDYVDAGALKLGLETFLAKPETQDAIDAYARA